MSRAAPSSLFYICACVCGSLGYDYSCYCNCHNGDWDLASIGGGGMGWMGWICTSSGEDLPISIRNAMQLCLPKGINTMSMPIGIREYEPAIDVYARTFGFKLLSIETLQSSGKEWVTFEMLPKREIEESKLMGVKPRPFEPDPEVPRYFRLSTPTPIPDIILKPEHIKPKPPEPEDPMAWAKELEQNGVTAGLPEHLYDLSTVNPIKLWVNKIIYKIRSWT